MKPGDRVEFGTLSPHGGDRLGVIQRAQRRYRQDGYWVIPLSGVIGDGFLPVWYPADMVGPWQPQRWSYDAWRNSWTRTYAEVKPSRGRRQ